MIIISIDVGIKNLALCCFEKKEGDSFFQIKQWDIVNIGEKEISVCQSIEEKEKEKSGKKSKAKSKTKLNSKSNPTANFVSEEIPTISQMICGKPAKFSKNNQCFCLKHAKKTNFLIPTNELKPAFINKQKVQKLFEMANQYHIPYDTKTKKADIISLLHEYANNTCLESINSVNASKVDIISIGQNIQTKLDEMFYKNDENGLIIDYVIIENQISPIANRMKTIQGMISQYFIMKGNVQQIEFISASNKLKDLSNGNGNGNGEKTEKGIKTEKMDYKDRKKAGIEKCIELLNQNPLFQEQRDHFQKHKKKDDLADCFLQGCWFFMQKLQLHNV